MRKKREVKTREKREKLITIKVKESTYRQLIRMKGAYEALLAIRLSTDEIIRLMINELPRLQVSFQKPEKGELPTHE